MIELFSYVGAGFACACFVVGAFVWLRWGWCGVAVIWSRREEIDDLCRREAEAPLENRFDEKIIRDEFRKTLSKVRAPFLVLLLCGAPALAQDVELQRRDLPAKPEPVMSQCLTPSGAPIPVYNAGDWLEPDEQFCAEQLEADKLVLSPKQRGAVKLWHIEPVGSCIFCAEPMSFRQAALDRQMGAMMALRVGLAVADIEITHRSPCFQAGTCREGNPLLGQSRAQAYAVTGAVVGAAWLGSAWLRKGNKHYRVGGMNGKWWRALVMANAAGNVIGIVSNLSRW